MNASVLIALCISLVLRAGSSNGISTFSAVVEDLYRRRQPLPSMDSIYFIQPSKEKYSIFPFYLFFSLVLISLVIFREKLHSLHM